MRLGQEARKKFGEKPDGGGTVLWVKIVWITPGASRRSDMNVRSNLDRMAKEAARENRQQLASAGVVAVNILGAPGCGKTSLLHASIQGLLLKRRIGIVRADPHCQCDRPQKLGDQLVHVDTGARVAMTPGDLRRALAELNLSSLDLLLIENVSSPTGPENVDLGEQAKVAPTA